MIQSKHLSSVHCILFDHVQSQFPQLQNISPKNKVRWIDANSHHMRFENPTSTTDDDPLTYFLHEYLDIIIIDHEATTQPPMGLVIDSLVTILSRHSLASVIAWLQSIARRLPMGSQVLFRVQPQIFHCSLLPAFRSVSQCSIEIQNQENQLILLNKSTCGGLLEQHQYGPLYKLQNGSHTQRLAKTQKGNLDETTSGRSARRPEMSTTFNLKVTEHEHQMRQQVELPYQYSQSPSSFDQEEEEDDLLIYEEDDDDLDL